MQRILLSVLGAVLMSASVPTQDLPLGPWLDTALRQGRANDRHIIWIYLRDKGSSSAERDSNAATAVSARARLRRAARGSIRPAMSREDAPIERTYLEQIRRHVAEVRHESRWLN